MIARLIGRIVCRFRGHRRGKRVRSEESGRIKVYACPRCQRETRYSQKAQA